VRCPHGAAITLGRRQEYLNNGNLPRGTKLAHQSLGPLLAKIKASFDCLLAACCARSDSLTTLDSGEQKPISKFLRDLERSKSWQDRLSACELGAAIERSQRYVDAVEFYESAMTSARSEEQKRFAIARWAKSKQRLETFYRGEKQYRRADEVKVELEKVKATHQIQETEPAAEYPALDTLPELLLRELSRSVLLTPIETAAGGERDLNIPMQQPISVTLAAPKPDVELMSGQLKLKFSRENKRINLEHQGTSKTATIRLSPVRCSSEDIVWIEEQGVHRCDEWGLQVDLSRLQSENVIVLRFASGSETKLELD
jgi:hypothetical protein